MDGALTCTSAPGQNWSGSNDYERVVHTALDPRTGTPQSDLVFCPTQDADRLLSFCEEL